MQLYRHSTKKYRDISGRFQNLLQMSAMKIFWTLLLVAFHLTGLTQVRIIVHLDSSIKSNFNGRLNIYTSTDTVNGVPNSPDFVNPQPMFYKIVSNWHYPDVMVIDDQAQRFSTSLSKLAPGVYKVAGVVDGNPEEHGAHNKGSYFSPREARLEINKDGKGETHLYLTREASRSFKENDSLKLVEFRSPLLSAFHKKDIIMKAAVLLPQGFDPLQTYPVVYVIPGWGGTHYDLQGRNPVQRYGMRQGLKKIYVYLNPETQTPWGLHAFVDSRVNGPWGKALVKELIPYIAKTYHASADPKLTFIVGQSSGGYPSLWLPLHYPEAFGGGWAVSPDPVDFSNFVGVPLYEKNANLYQDREGNLRPFFLMNGKPLTTLKMFCDIENFEGDGGQMQSFEAEFGKPDAAGRPRQLYDRKTGAINAAVVKDWEDYDLGKWVEKNWPKVSRKLSGKKLHVYAGQDDNFFLNAAVLNFGERAKKVSADIVVELFPNSDHFSIWNPAFTARVQQEIDELIGKQ